MKKGLSLIMLLMVVTFSLKASHIVGGDLTVKWIGPTKNDFQIQLRVFRSCSPGSASMNTSFDVRIYDKVTNVLVNTITITNPVINANLPFGDACFTPTGLCVDEGIFTQNVTIVDNPNGYYLSAQVCCRNASITNITSPSSAGMTFYCEIPDPGNTSTLNNSNPDMGPYPMDAYLCVNLSKNFNFSVTDVDGDSLYYSLSEPLNDVPAGAGPYNPVTWSTGYSLANIVGGTPPMSINPLTGVMTASPTVIGTFVFAVKVEEFRNGVKIGETRRDAQYESLNCTTDAPPNFLNNLSNGDTLKIPFESSFCESLVFQDPDVGDTVFIDVSSNIYGLGAYTPNLTPVSTNPNMYEYFYDYGTNSVIIPANQYDTTENAYWNLGTVATGFCWQPTDCELIGKTFDFKVNSFSLGCAGRAEDSVSFFVSVVPPEDTLRVIPNVFTPNGDGLNEVYKIDGIYNRCNDNITVEIYNRWGIKIYESNDPLFEWNGKNKSGNKVPEGTYFIIIKGTYASESIVLEKRTVTLLR